MPTGERRDYTQEEREKGKKAAAKEKYKAYQRAVESEKEMEKDSEHRESANTGGQAAAVEPGHRRKQLEASTMRKRRRGTRKVEHQWQ